MTRAAVIVLVALYGAATITLVARSTANNSYASVSSLLAGAGVTAGLTLLTCGSIAWVRPGAGALGPLTIALGVTWLAADWIAWPGGSEALRTVATLALPLTMPLLLHLVLVAPRGQLKNRGGATLVLAAYGATLAISVVRGAVYDPLLDLSCWRTCTANSLLVASNPDAAQTLDSMLELLGIALGLATFAVAGVRLAEATTVGRRTLAPLLLPAGVASAALAATAGLRWRLEEDPLDPVFSRSFLLVSLSLLAVGLGVGWTLVRESALQRALTQIAEDLGDTPLPGSLEATLRRAVGDPDLDVAYRLDGPEAYVDAYGRRCDPFADSRRATTAIVRGPRTIAVVSHDPTVADQEILEREIGAAARLAADNERLRAQVLSQLEDVRASAARVVEAEDQARERIERDLHDGAQQRLLALSYELRLARADAQAAGDADRASALADASEQAQSALAELRELAHGIYPAILTEAGLGPALGTLAATASIPVTVAPVPDGRFDPALERAVYVVSSRAIEHAASTARGIDIRLTLEEEQLRLTIDGLAAQPTEGSLDGSAHRVRAIGGTLYVTGGTLRAEIPCG